MATTPGPAPPSTVDLLSRLVDAGLEAAKFVVVAAIIYGAGRFLVLPVVRRASAAADVEETLHLTIVRVVNASFVLFALYVAVTLSGLATTPNLTAAFAAAATIALGFAAQDVLGNLVSGVFIVVDPKVRVGDWIRWNGREGVIEDISFRVTRVHTFDNELVTVPNSELTDNVVVNPVAKDRLRITVEFGVGYEDDLDEAREIVIDVADTHPDILDRPRATVQVAELADSYVGLTARFWIDQPARTDFIRIRSEFVQTVKERYDAAGIEMPYPYRQLTGEIGTHPARDETPDGVR
jgi:small-conductance mechanosensitive channel